MTNRTDILDRLFTNAESIMARLVEKQGYFSNLDILHEVCQDQQVAYIDLLYFFRDTENRSPFNATHQEIGKRIYNVATSSGYVRDESLDRRGADIFRNPTAEKFYR